jgi:hypothetical protein
MSHCGGAVLGTEVIGVIMEGSQIFSPARRCEKSIRQYLHGLQQGEMNNMGVTQACMNDQWTRFKIHRQYPDAQILAHEYYPKLALMEFFKCL